MRIGVASIALESNTFNPAPTTLQDFQASVFLTGAELWQLEESHHELGGFLSELKLQGAQAVPLFAAGAAPGGTLLASDFDELKRLLHDQLAAAGSLDGLLLAPHGAMAAENALDADGTWLDEVRQHVGTNIPLVATIDPHANLSARMVAATDALIAYKTNPHLDQRQRGVEAAQLLMRAVKGDIRLTQAACFSPLVIEIERQFTSEGACAELLKISQQLSAQPGVLSSSLVLGFPYADVPEMGSATIVVTDGNLAQAQNLADAFGAELWNRREDLKSQLTSIPDAVRQAASAHGVTCLLDMGDNVGGGSPGDTTVLIEEILRQSAGPALAVLIDPDSASQAATAGIGARLNLQVGGKLPATVGRPIAAEFTVVAVSDGRFSEEEPRHGGQLHFDQGVTAVLESPGLTIVAISKRCPPFSLRQITHLGVDPRCYRILIAKGVHAPVAAYAPVCDRFIRVNTPGITAADTSLFTYLHRRRPMFPFEEKLTVCR